MNTNLLFLVGICSAVVIFGILTIDNAEAKPEDDRGNKHDHELFRTEFSQRLTNNPLTINMTDTRVCDIFSEDCFEVFSNIPENNITIVCENNGIIEGGKIHMFMHDENGIGAGVEWQPEIIDGYKGFNVVVGRTNQNGDGDRGEVTLFIEMACLEIRTG